MLPVSRTLNELPCFRIKAADTNHFVIVADPIGDGVPFITTVEIFDPGGATPPNVHATAWEQFVCLAGTGRARYGGVETTFSAGDALLLPPGVEHVIENVGAGKLYCLGTLMPDEGFGALIRAGIPMALGDDDRLVLKLLERPEPAP